MLSSIGFFVAQRRTLGCLAAGGTAVLLSSPAQVLDACDRLAVDHLSLVVPQARQLLRLLAADSTRGPRLPRLRSLTIGSSPVPESLRRELRANLSAEVRVSYGMNELGEASIAPPALQDRHPGCVGRACAGVEIEAVLEQHPDVVEAAAFPVPSEQHHQVPVASVQVSAAVDERQLIAFCRERLGVRTPVRVLMVRELPRNPGGKVDKQRLLRHLTEGMRGAPRTPRP